MTMLFFATAFSFGALGNSNTMVYVCTGGSAYAYHCNRGCRGLNRCGASIMLLCQKLIAWGVQSLVAGVIINCLPYFCKDPFPSISLQNALSPHLSHLGARDVQT